MARDIEVTVHGENCDETPQLFACGHGHAMMAWDENDEAADLAGHFCPLCLGEIVGHGDIVDLRILAPVQPVTKGPS